MTVVVPTGSLFLPVLRRAPGRSAVGPGARHLFLALLLALGLGHHAGPLAPLFLLPLPPLVNPQLFVHEERVSELFGASFPLLVLPPTLGAFQLPVR